MRIVEHPVLLFVNEFFDAHLIAQAQLRAAHDRHTWTGAGLGRAGLKIDGNGRGKPGFPAAGQFDLCFRTGELDRLARCQQCGHGAGQQGERQCAPSKPRFSTNIHSDWLSITPWLATSKGNKLTVQARPPFKKIFADVIWWGCW